MTVHVSLHEGQYLRGKDTVLAWLYLCRQMSEFSHTIDCALTYLYSSVSRISLKLTFSGFLFPGVRYRIMVNVVSKIVDFEAH